jgi:Ca2+/Na+ antiporter
MMGEP